jgi:hypothetical protein
LLEDDGLGEVVVVLTDEGLVPVAAAAATAVRGMSNTSDVPSIEPTEAISSDNQAQASWSQCDPTHDGEFREHRWRST